jgi:hypothetical protein
LGSSAQIAASSTRRVVGALIFQTTAPSRAKQVMIEHAPQIKVLTRLELYFSVRHINKALRLFADLFDHDYDTLAIFLTVAEVCLQAIFHLVALDPDQVDLEQLYADVNAVGMTALAVGELTGIPRETVRRKLKSLIDEGYLAVSPKNRNIYLPPTTIMSDRFVEIFGAHIRDIGQLVRSVSYYQRDPS